MRFGGPGIESIGVFRDVARHSQDSHLFLGRLVPHGLVCASIHERSFFRPLGDQSRFKVRMSNQIWFNTAPRFNWEADCFWMFMDHLVPRDNVVDVNIF